MKREDLVMRGLRNAAGLPDAARWLGALFRLSSDTRAG